MNGLLTDCIVTFLFRSFNKKCTEHLFDSWAQHRRKMYKLLFPQLLTKLKLVINVFLSQMFMDLSIHVWVKFKLNLAVYWSSMSFAGSGFWCAFFLKFWSVWIPQLRFSKPMWVSKTPGSACNSLPLERIRAFNHPMVGCFLEKALMI